MQNRTKEQSFDEDHESYPLYCRCCCTGRRSAGGLRRFLCRRQHGFFRCVQRGGIFGGRFLRDCSGRGASEAKVKAQFTVTGADGESQTFDLEVTDGEKLSDALAEAGIISADEAAAGFVTTVNGETADWDKDSAWWCLTDASGEMTAVGVADIELHGGDRYAFIYTK